MSDEKEEEKKSSYTLIIALRPYNLPRLFCFFLLLLSTISWGFVVSSCFSTSDTFARMHMVNLRYNFNSTLLQEHISTNEITGNDIKVMVGLKGICSRDMTAVNGVSSNMNKGELLCNRLGDTSKLHQIPNVTFDLNDSTATEYFSLYTIAKKFSKHAAHFELTLTTCVINCIALITLVLFGIFPISHDNIVNYSALILLIVQGLLSFLTAIVISSSIRSFCYVLGAGSLHMVDCRGRAMPIGISWLATCASFTVTCFVFTLYYRGRDESLIEQARAAGEKVQNV